jgi:hypothetical protein
MPRLAPVTRAVRPASFMGVLFRAQCFGRSHVAALGGWAKSARATTCMRPRSSPFSLHLMIDTHDGGSSGLPAHRAQARSQGPVRGLLDSAADPDQSIPLARARPLAWERPSEVIHKPTSAASGWRYGPCRISRPLVTIVSGLASFDRTAAAVIALEQLKPSLAVRQMVDRHALDIRSLRRWASRAASGPDVACAAVISTAAMLSPIAAPTRPEA